MASSTSAWLSTVLAAILNKSAAPAQARQLTVAGDRMPVPLVYGEDRIGALVLNVVVQGSNVLYQCVWSLAGDGVSDVRYNDQPLPAGSSVVSYTGTQTAPDAGLVAAYAAQGITYGDALTGYQYSVVTMPQAAFTGSLALSALVRGRKVYDPRQDAASNLLVRSEEFDAWATKTNVTIDSDITAAPNGTQTADFLKETTATGVHEVSQGVVLASGMTYALSVYAKAGTRTRVRLAGRTAGSWSAFPSGVFDLTNGVVVSSTGTAAATVESVGGGWYRCVIFGSTSATAGGLTIGLISSGTTSNYTGDGSSGLYVWGAQLKAGSVPGTYNRTGATLGTHVLATPSTWEWSDCPSLHDADFLASSAYGAGKTVDYDSVIGAANANDALVGGEKRRQSAASFISQVPVKVAAETLRAYAGVFHLPSANGIRLVPDRPAAVVASYSHAAGQIAAVHRVEKKDSGNVPTLVEVIYTDRSTIPWRDASAIVQAPGVDVSVPRRVSQVAMTGLYRYSQAYREATERLNKLRTSDLGVSWSVFDAGIAHEAADVVELSLPVGLSAKPIRLVDAPEWNDGVWRLTGVEYDPGAYSDAVVAGPTYADTNLTNPALAPAAPTGLTYSFSSRGIELSWNRNQELTVAEYELRVGGTDWASATPMTGSLPTLVAGTTFTWAPQLAGTRVVRLKARTTLGVESTNAASVSVVIVAPTLGSLTASISGTSYVLDWTAGTTSQPVAFYRVRRAGSVIAEVNSSRFSALVDWSGSVTFAVSAVDSAGNEGAALSQVVSITSPTGVGSFTASTVINTVVFYWSAPVSPLPISSYLLKKGSTWAGAQVIGRKAGDQTFTTFLESEAGEFTYWIAAIDTAGNEGAPTSLTVRVAAPANFKLTNQWQSTFSGTKTGCVVENGALLAPVITTETFEQHFTSRSWTTPDQQIAAGYELYIQPSGTSASYVETFDATNGASTNISASLVSITATGAVLDGAVTVTPKIEVATNAAPSTWVSLGNVWEALASTFRYVRITLTFTASGGDDLYQLTALGVKLSLQTEIDSGSKTAASFSAGVCAVTFSKPFIDVDSIVVTPMSTARREWAVEFSDVPNPTGFNVRIWDSAGTLTPTDFSWQATGVV